jgi:hypothetical protein
VLVCKELVEEDFENDTYSITIENDPLLREQAQAAQRRAARRIEKLKTRRMKPKEERMKAAGSKGTQSQLRGSNSTYALSRGDCDCD